MTVGGKAKVLNAQEWAKLEKVGQSITHRTIWALLRFTGCRSQEARLLKVNNVYIDPAKGEIRELIFFPKKIRKGKKFSISVPVTEKLKWYLQQYQPPNSGYLFPSPRNSEKPISYEAIYKYMKSAAAKAGMSHHKIATHSGRRSLITHLHENGVSLKTIQGITGHASLQNLQPYVEVYDSLIRAALNGTCL